MKNFTKTILASFVLLFVLSNLGWGQTLVNYKFENNLNPESGSVGSPSLTFSITPSYFTGTTGQALSTSTGSNANGAFIELTISSSGYQNLKLSWAGRTSNSTNSGSWVLTGDYGSGYGSTIHTQSLSTSFVNTGEISLGSVYDNKSTIRLKITA